MKRGDSGLSLVVAVDKPSGMSSHDVVNRCRRIFGEKRVGHTGTLDPLASGVLPICVGPATRLDAYMVEHDKRYDVQVVFGMATDTDDCLGSPIKTAPVPPELFEEEFARSFVEGLIGPHRQLPPVYSAIKVGGVKACDAARKGTVIDLTPRDIEVHSACLLSIEQVEDAVAWNVAFHVSKGTYIRSLARDMGNSLGCPAHVGALRRTSVGLLTLDECVSLETLERLGVEAALDPVRLLGLRMLFLSEEQEKLAANGGSLSPRSVRLYERRSVSAGMEFCACTAGVCESSEPLRDGEVVCALARNTLAALYRFEGDRCRLKPCCVFQTGVSRGADI